MLRPLVRSLSLVAILAGSAAAAPADAPAGTTHSAKSSKSSKTAKADKQSRKAKSDHKARKHKKAKAAKKHAKAARRPTP